MLPAARATDLIACPLPGHVSNPATGGSTSTLINQLPALRHGDTSTCGALLVEGNPTILIDSRRAIYLGASTAHGGKVIGGSPNVFWGTQTLAVAGKGDLLTNKFSEQYEFLNEVTKQPVAGLLYCITAPDGRQYVGRTDKMGKTERIITENKEKVIVRWGKEAATYLRRQGTPF